MSSKEQVITPLKTTGELLAKGAFHGAKFIGERVMEGSPLGPRGRLGGSQEEAVREFDGRLAVVTGLMESEDADTMVARAAETAKSMVDKGVVDETTEVELRTMMPEEALRRGEFIQKSLAGMGLLKLFLSRHNVSATSNGFPIMPSKTEQAPVSPRRVWGAIGSELSELKRQYGPRRRLAMLAISETPYARRVFADAPQTEDQPRHLDNGRLMVVRSIGDGPEEHMLMPPRLTTPPDARKLLPESTSHPLPGTTPADNRQTVSGAV